MYSMNQSNSQNKWFLILRLNYLENSNWKYENFQIWTKTICEEFGECAQMAAVSGVSRWLETCFQLFAFKHRHHHRDDYQQATWVFANILLIWNIASNDLIWHMSNKTSDISSFACLTSLSCFIGLLKNMSFGKYKTKRTYVEKKNSYGKPWGRVVRSGRPFS